MIIDRFYEISKLQFLQYKKIRDYEIAQQTMKTSNYSSPFTQIISERGSPLKNQTTLIQQAGKIIQYPRWQKSTTQKPCDRYGLDPQKLKNPQLQKYRGYRRLLNIVANDQTSVTQVFRPNLIKQLYFLLQITPFIEDSLKDNFLNKIEQWYNSNDHKKIKLSKNLNGIIENVIRSKKASQSGDQKTQNKANKRPKSSVGWNKDLHPFLRPYTAKLGKSANNSHHKSTCRPQSSKFGASTNAHTNYIEQKNNLDDQQYIDGLQQQIKKDIEEDQRQICDIEQQWQRSLDFKKKYRTLHPQQEPTYQKLMGLISKAKIHPPSKQTRNTLQDENSLTGINSASSANKQWQNKRKIQSAMITRQMSNVKALAQIQLNNQLNTKNGVGQDQKLNADINNDQDDQEQNNNQIAEYEEDDDDQDKINLNQKYGKFKSDKRSRQGRRLQPQNGLYSTLNGAKILRPFTAKQSHIINKLDQYSNMEQNKRVIQSNFDEECAQKYKQYVRKKNTIKRQMSRKSQSKRYMQNFKNIVNILPNNYFKTPPLPSAIISENKQKIESSNKQNILIQLVNKTVPQKQVVEKVSKVDKQSQKLNESQDEFQQKLFSKPKQNVMKSVFDFASPSTSQNLPVTYNSRQFFQGIKKQKIAKSFRNLHKIELDNSTQSTGVHKRMTYQKRLLSQQKFDPLHKNNLINYNNQALQQIERIKQRFGGKISASTDCLIKALYVDAPIPVHNVDSYQNLLQTKFQIPDKRYLMVQKQEKKKKKRKLKKLGAGGSNNKSLNKIRR